MQPTHCEMSIAPGLTSQNHKTIVNNAKILLKIYIHVCWRISKPGHQHTKSVKTCLKIEALKPIIKKHNKFIHMIIVHVKYTLHYFCIGGLGYGIIQAHSRRLFTVGGPGSIPQPSMSHMCCPKYHWDKFFSIYLGFLL